MKRPAAPAILAVPKTIHIGVTPGIPAIIGAAIETVRATILQIPIEVAVKRVGKSSALDKYTMLKAAEIPSLDTSTRIGRVQVLVSVVYQPHTQIVKVPAAASAYDATRDHLTPIDLIKKPEAVVEIKSAVPDAYVFV